MQSHEVGPVRWGITFIGATVTVILMIAVVLTGIRWSLKQFDQMVDAKSIIKVEHMKLVDE